MVMLLVMMQVLLTLMMLWILQVTQNALKSVLLVAIYEMLENSRLVLIEIMVPIGTG